MKVFALTASILMLAQLALAGLTRPYKVITISCASMPIKGVSTRVNSLVMTWKVPRSSFAESVFVNGVDRSGGVHRYVEGNKHIYLKPDIFQIVFDADSEAFTFTTPAIIQGQRDFMTCNKIVSSIQFTE